MLIGLLYIFCELFPFPVQILSSLPFITSRHSQDPRFPLPPSPSIEGNNAQSVGKGPDEVSQVTRCWRLKVFPVRSVCVLKELPRVGSAHLQRLDCFWCHFRLQQEKYFRTGRSSWNPQMIVNQCFLGLSSYLVSR